MQGTIVCGVTDCEEGRGALELAVELSRRLGLRLVLAHVAEGFASINGAEADPDNESVTMKANRRGGEVLLARLAREYGIGESAECRVAVRQQVSPGEIIEVPGLITAEPHTNPRHR